MGILDLVRLPVTVVTIFYQARKASVSTYRFIRGVGIVNAVTAIAIAVHVLVIIACFSVGWATIITLQPDVFLLPH